MVTLDRERPGGAEDMEEGIMPLKMLPGDVNLEVDI